MKKSKLAAGILTALVSVGALAACDNTVKYSKGGIILKYTANDGSEKTLYADGILKDYYNDSSKYQSIFDSVYSIVVRNYFNKSETVKYIASDGTQQTKEVGAPDMDQIKIDAQHKVDNDKETAKTNADNNNTSYKKEFETILSGKGAENEAELKDKYIEELQKEKFDENFYKYHLEDLKFGEEGDNPTKIPGTSDVFWKGYINDMAPYHVSHILVKLEDGSGTNYSNGTISEENAKKLYNVVNALKEGEDGFGTIAFQNSEDTGSAANYGDLGIMDYSTGYVNEFKLGIYAYRNMVEGTQDGEVIKYDHISDYASEAKKSFDNKEEKFPTIPFSVFEELKSVADVTKDKNQEAVLDDSANFYPRNIIYNKYLNRHEAALVTFDGAWDNAQDAEALGHTVGFHVYTDGNLAEFGPVLSAKVNGEWTPFLCVRAGSDYQGIHFIIVNRSPFVETQNNVSLKEYYTTFWPEQAGYPKYHDDATNKDLPKKTYVNFSSSDPTATKTRAEGLESTVKGYDSDKLNKYIFQKYFEFEGLKFADEELQNTLTMWIQRGIEKKNQETLDAWDKTWSDYIDTLKKQNSERTKLVSQACKIGFSKEYAQTTSIEDVIASLKTAMVEAKEAADETEAEKMIRGIMVAGELIQPTSGSKDEILTIEDLFKTKGALCNDGKAHF